MTNERGLGSEEPTPAGTPAGAISDRARTLARALCGAGLECGFIAGLVDGADDRVIASQLARLEEIFADLETRIANNRAAVGRIRERVAG